MDPRVPLTREFMLNWLAQHGDDVSVFNTSSDDDVKAAYEKYEHNTDDYIDLYDTEDSSLDKVLDNSRSIEEKTR